MCFNIVLAPTYVFATTNLGGWSIGGLVADGASSIVNGSKNVVINGVNVVKNSTAKITPTVGAVSKVLARGAAGYALSVAVQQLLGAVDWVLDPANNQIVYQKPIGGVQYQDPLTKTLYPTAIAALTAMCVAKVGSGGVIKSTSNYSSTQVKGECDDPNTGYPTDWNLYASIVTNAQTEQKTLPLDVLAAQVISNAHSETDQQKKAGAQTATTTAAQDLLDTDSGTRSNVQNQLETNARTQTNEQATGEAKPVDPANPTAGDALKLNFPVFCGWAPVVCEAAQVAISFPQTVTNWWTTATAAISASWTSFKEWLDWTKNDDSLPDSEQNSVTELPTPELQENAISWGASCPADVQIPISLYGQSSTLTFSWSPWCQLLSIIKPAIIASAYIGAAFIVLGLRT